MRPDTLHLTLVFIGQVAQERLPGLLEIAADVRVASFVLDFDLEACWRHNRIAHLGASRPPEALFALVRQLEGGLEAGGLAFDRRPYVPHVTLIRNAGCGVDRSGKENPAPEPVSWPVRDFVLVRSSLRPEGARYEQIGAWPLF